MTKYLTNLTPMRGIAALLTVIFHVDVMVGYGGDFLVKRSQSMILSRMYLMVDFFFILSGFIMCYVYGKMFLESVDKGGFKKFTIARFARVYPLHFITLGYCILLFFVGARLGIPENPVLQISNNAGSLATNLLLLHSMNFHNWFSWNHASWSISTEWWAYMVFPFLVAPIQKTGGIGKAALVVLCFAGYLCITYFLVPVVSVPPEIPFVRVDPAQLSVNVSYQYGFLRCLSGFVLGMLVFEAFRVNWLKKFFSNGLLLSSLFLGAMASMHFDLPDFITVLFFPLIILCGAYGSPQIDRFFSVAPLQRLGDWSFSIYLIHQPVLFTIGTVIAWKNLSDPTVIVGAPPPKPDILTAWLICIVIIAIVLAISYLTYRFYELPARNWINKRRKGG